MATEATTNSQPSRSGQSPFIDAVCYNEIDKIRKLLEENPDLVHETVCFGDGRNAVHFGISSYSPFFTKPNDQVLPLLVKHGLNIDHREKSYNSTPLDHCVHWYKYRFPDGSELEGDRSLYLEKIQQLIHLGADVNGSYKDRSKSTASTSTLEKIRQLPELSEILQQQNAAIAKAVSTHMIPDLARLVSEYTSPLAGTQRPLKEGSIEPPSQ